MRADLAKLANQMTRMTMGPLQPMQQVQQMSICCEMCGDNHTSDMCPTNPESIYYVGQQSRGPMNQHAQYGNTYNANWRNHPNFSWGENQSNQNQYRPQGNFNQPQRPPQQVEENTNDLLKKLLQDNQQLRTDFRNLERQLGQLAANQNTRPAGALPSDTEKNPQVSAITLRTGRELDEVPKKRKDKPVPEDELIPKATQEVRKDDTISAPKEKLLRVLHEHKRAIGWTMSDIRGISPAFCMHKILMEGGNKPSIEQQRRLNSNMKEAVRKEVIKWLDACIVFPISDSKWVDKAKVEAIKKLPPPTSVRGIRSFLGHAGFHRRFIKDFSKISSPLCTLLEKDTSFKFDDACLKTFDELK
ncbi:uncharacterized protein [Nicotiana sylvestris]|uniref:uncharacterized protein n=1 Tax=Nicotiana sylvestris TaxID=4096 RepID=UPI00388C7BC2